MSNPLEPIYRAQDRATASNKQFEEVNEKWLERTARFFERLALLHGGALTLSVTFLGLLSGRTSPTECVVILHSSWGAFLIGLIAALYRNYSHEHYQWRATQAMLARDQTAVLEEMQKLGLKGESATRVASQLTTFRQQSARDLSRSKWHWRCYVFTEWLAQILLVVGLALLAFFAVLNTA